MEKVLDDGKSFLEFFPEWKDAVLWQEWRQFGIQCFSESQDSSIPFSDNMYAYGPSR